MSLFFPRGKWWHTLPFGFFSFQSKGRALKALAWCPKWCHYIVKTKFSINLQVPTIRHTSDSSETELQWTSRWQEIRTWSSSEVRWGQVTSSHNSSETVIANLPEWTISSEVVVTRHKKIKLEVSKNLCDIKVTWHKTWWNVLDRMVLLLLTCNRRGRRSKRPRGRWPGVRPLKGPRKYLLITQQKCVLNDVGT